MEASRYNRRNWLKVNSLALASLALPLCSAARLDQPLPSIPNHLLSTKGIRLVANENPYGPSKKAVQAIIESAHLGNRYQIPLRDALKEAIAKKENLKPENILIGAGSSEILGIIGHKYVHNKGSLLTSENTFPMMVGFMKNLGVETTEIPIDKNYRFDLTGIQNAVSEQTGLVYMCNPNNPTGTMVNTQKLERFCKEVAVTTPVFVDEAYIEYTIGGRKNSMAHLINDFPYVFISRTFSKIYGLAGMRIGYALAHEDVIADLKRYHSGFEISVSASGLSAALASINDNDFLDMSLNKNNAVKAYFYKSLDELNIPYAQSETNFVFFPLNKFRTNSDDFATAFKDQKIQIRPFPRKNPQWARITLGTWEEMEQVVSLLESLV